MLRIDGGGEESDDVDINGCYDVDEDDDIGDEVCVNSCDVEDDENDDCGDDEDVVISFDVYEGYRDTLVARKRVFSRSKKAMLMGILAAVATKSAPEQ
jgi:hypothetical protein